MASTFLAFLHVYFHHFSLINIFINEMFKNFANVLFFRNIFFNHIKTFCPKVYVLYCEKKIQCDSKTFSKVGLNCAY